MASVSHTTAGFWMSAPAATLRLVSGSARFVLCLLLGATACGPAATDDPDAAPTLTGKTLAGDYWSLLDARGKVVLVNVWATWCAPCRNELPVLAGLHREFGGPQFEVIGVSVDSDADEDQVRAMAGRFGLDYRIVLDPSKRVTVDWKVTSFPTSVLLDHAGHIVWRKPGELGRDDPELLSHIKAALRGLP